MDYEIIDYEIDYEMENQSVRLLIWSDPEIGTQ